MAEEIAIKVDHVSKSFKLPHERQTSIKSSLINLVRGGKRSFERQQVLDDVSFEVRKGEFFGIVGRNGSGKSTMLKLLAGIYHPDKGGIAINGPLTPFIELGVGFNPELTGRENVFLNGALLGFNRREMEAMYDDIVDFAELERFMDQKLKNYSSGMQVRLAFSIAIRVNSGILLLDEVLAVGDAIFQQKCFDYFKELKRDKKTVVLVSHDANALQQYCDRGILIEKGRIVTTGPIEGVINQYRDILVAQEEAQQEKVKDEKTENRWGSREMEVIAISLSNTDDAPQKVFGDDNTAIRVKVTYKAHTACESPVYGITINDTTGQQQFASNTLWSRIESPDMIEGSVREVVWDVPNVFNTGTFMVNPAVANSTGTVMYDWREAFAKFKIRKKLQSTAPINVAHRIVSRPIKNKGE